MKLKRIIAMLLAVVMVACSVMLAPITSNAGAYEVKHIEDSSTSMSHIVYYPANMEQGSAKYPLIIWANGTGCSPSLYEDLHTQLASNGFVVVASSETMAADGTDQIASLDYIISKSKQASSVFYNKIATNKVCAMGHSQGGRSAVNAGAADSRFSCVVSIAGSNYDYEAEKLAKPTFFITGTSDRIVDSKKWVKTAYDACKGTAVYASVKKAVHTTCSSAPEQYVYYSVKWINAWTAGNRADLNAFKAGAELSKDSNWTEFECKKMSDQYVCSATLSKTKLVYNAKAQKPSVVVKDQVGRTIASSNYTVTYSTGSKNVGKYKATVTFKGDYSGAITKTYVINPKPTTISSLSALSKGFKVKWSKKTAQTTGYQIRYSLKSSMASSKTVTVKGAKTTSKSISKLKKGKKYYVQVRTYKTVDGKKYYSSWSAKKSVKTK